MKKVMICIILLLYYSSLNALITQWTGDTNTDWANASNWTDGVPNSTHSVIIPSSVTSGNWPDLASGSYTCYEVANYGNLRVSGGTLNTNNDFVLAGTLDQESGTITVNGLSTFNSTGTADIAGGDFWAKEGVLVEDGSSLTFSGGSLQYGQTSGNFNSYGSIYVTGGTLWAGGSAEFFGYPSSDVTVNSGYFSIGDFSTAGTLDLQGGGTYFGQTTVSGTLTQSGGTLNVNDTFTNEGTVNQTGGTANVNSDFNNNATGSFSLGGTGQWAVSDHWQNIGHYGQTDGTLEVNGAFTNDGSVEQSGGSATIGTDFTNNSSGTFNLSGSGQWAVSNHWQNIGHYGQTGGTLDVDGTYTNNSGGVFQSSGGLWAVRDINNQGNFYQEGATGTVSEGIINDDSFEQSSGSTSVTEDFTNNSGGVFRSSGGLWAVRSIDNQGLFEQSSGTGTINQDLLLGSSSSNTQTGGTLNVKGDVEINQSFVNSGSTGELIFNGGTTQSVTNPPAMPYTNIVPNLKVNSNSTVTFDDKTSFSARQVEIENGTLDIGGGILDDATFGSGTLELGDNGVLEIGGSNSLPDFGTHTFAPTSTVTYKSTTQTQEIKGKNYGKLEVSGSDKFILDDVNVGNEFILNQTVVDLRDNDFTIQDGGVFTYYMDCYFATTGTGYFKMENVSSGFFPIGPDLTNYNGFSFDNDGVALNSIGARIETGINPTHPNASYCLQRTWDIIKDGVLNADFTFQWLQTQETQPFEQARTNSRIVGHLCHTPPSWQVVTTPSGATGTGSLSDPYEFDMDNMVLVSGFCLGDGDHTLPITLSSFNAVYSNDAGIEFVQVNWTTSTETDVHGYNVYKSETDVFDEAYIINPSLIYGQGTTTTGYSYSFDDLDANVDVRNYYWIDQLDYSGTSELFGPAVFIPEDNNEPGSQSYSETKVLQQYPNPVENNLKIEYQIKGSAAQQDAVIYIYNMKGEFIDTIFGQNGTTEIDLSDYATGVYFYRLQNTSLGETYKFVVIR